MSTVQEIQKALARLSIEELDLVEKWIADHKHRLEPAESEDYVQLEYGPRFAYGGQLYPNATGNAIAQMFARRHINDIH